MQKPGAALSLISQWCRHAGESRGKSRIIMDSSGLSPHHVRPDRQRSMMCVRRICSRRRLTPQEVAPCKSHSTRGSCVGTVFEKRA